MLSNMLSRFITAFIPRSKSFNFMAAVTTYSDFGTQENKICHCFQLFPFYLPLTDGRYLFLHLSSQKFIILQNAIINILIQKALWQCFYFDNVDPLKLHVYFTLIHIFKSFSKIFINAQIYLQGIKMSVSSYSYNFCQYHGKKM